MKKKKTSKLVRVDYYVTSAQKNKIVSLAKKLNTSASDIIRSSIKTL